MEGPARGLLSSTSDAAFALRPSLGCRSDRHVWAGQIDANEGEVVVAEALFVYGTLMDPEVQRRVIGRVVPLIPDTLAGYRKGEIVLGKNTYPIAVRDPDREIAGAVMLLTPSEVRRTDRYEGKAYERGRVVLTSGTEAWVYRSPETDGGD